MNSIKLLSRTVGLRAIVLLTLGMAVVAFSSWPAIAHGFADRPGVVASETQMMPRQQTDEFEGESELPWLFAVFFIAWAAFFAYVFVMSRRQREMRNEIDVLKSVLAEKERQREFQAEKGPGA